MAFYQIVVKLKNKPTVNVIREYDEPYPKVKKKVEDGAETAWGSGNIIEISIYRLQPDSPTVKAYLDKKKGSKGGK